MIIFNFAKKKLSFFTDPKLIIILLCTFEDNHQKHLTRLFQKIIKLKLSVRIAQLPMVQQSKKVMLREFFTLFQSP